MSWRNRTSSAIVNAAAYVSLAPAKAITLVAPDNGPGGPAWAAITSAFSLAITSPVTVPMLIVATLIRENR